MPYWLQVLGIIVGIAAIGTPAINKVIRPILRVAIAAEKTAPILQELTIAFSGQRPGALNVLQEIASQFRTDHGSTLRDVVNDIDKAAQANKQAAAIDRELAIRDREQIAQLLKELNIITERLMIASATVDRLEAISEQVAADLAIAQQEVNEVKLDLAKSHERADMVAGPHGAAADAAAQQTQQEIVLIEEADIAEGDDSAL